MSGGALHTAATIQHSDYDRAWMDLIAAKHALEEAFRALAALHLRERRRVGVPLPHGYAAVPPTPPTLP